MKATKAATRLRNDQMIRALLGGGGIRLAGVYGSPYPNKPITRYHVIAESETHRTYTYEQFVIGPEYAAHPRYGAYVGQKALKAVETATTYYTFACGIENMREGEDIREMVPAGGERATDAPLCKSCARVAAQAGFAADVGA